MPDNKQKVLAALHDLHSKIDLCNRLISGVTVTGENLVRCGSVLQLLDEADAQLSEVINDNWWN